VRRNLCGERASNCPLYRDGAGQLFCVPEGKMSNHRNLTERLRSVFLEMAGWLIPLIVSGPSLFIWAGLMTMPLIVYLGIMFLSLFDPTIRFHGQEPSGFYFLSALDVLLLGGPHLPDKVMSVLGIVIMVYATVHLNLKRKGGLVTSGLYRVVRNPQYFGAILFTINLTSRSYREVLGDVGWLGPGGTLAVWLGTLGAYILLALIEEAHLTREFGAAYAAYRNKVAFLIPFVATRRRWLEIGASIFVPVLLLWGLVVLNGRLYP
jgi:protein-S-isoprenylcysteine O-methyltransferase Ste14